MRSSMRRYRQCVSCYLTQTVPSAPDAPPLVVFLNQYLLCPVLSQCFVIRSERIPPPHGLDVLNAFPLGLISQFKP